MVLICVVRVENLGGINLFLATHGNVTLHNISLN